MCGRGARSWVQILLLVKYLDLHGASCYGHGQHPKVWVSMESFKSLTMECFLGYKKKKKKKKVYTYLFATSDWKPSLSGLFFERLEDLVVVGLEKPFTEEEVFGALSGFSGGKAPSPNGFSMAFW